MTLKAPNSHRGDKKVAEALDTSVDYLIYGSAADKVSESLHDPEAIRYFKGIEALPHDNKDVQLRVIAAFIRDIKTKQTYTH
ncbi:hypothetical protein J2T02_001272 [Chitinophaga terrae (ex Kim and Jung 2007)]|uniref:hypothetical protein n=1 Tax=Chitinophaga terrae (ex Kim and Jung 2007) TaxID=408074 RepID=UPI00278ABBCD|nr:hypothetical protein [Chitinophaga terrae (ex Kim and Jung 2007)]MDQ0106178.1 hypothetical protein [Chitinophaga terrae (ex Kim and Jung 2007)]